jgi:putative holliday junction resolvase
MTNIIALDVGTKRIGVAIADTLVPIASPFTTIEVDGDEMGSITGIVKDKLIEVIVVGYPRNQSGDPTEQTLITERLAKQLEGIAKIVFQDESLTSVMAEDRLKSRGKPYDKAAIDAEAATIILQDYLEMNYAA